MGHKSSNPQYYVVSPNYFLPNHKSMLISQLTTIYLLHYTMADHPDLHHGQGDVETPDCDPDVDVPGDQKDGHREGDQSHTIHFLYMVTNRITPGPGGVILTQVKCGRKPFPSYEICCDDQKWGGEDYEVDLENIGDKGWEEEWIDTPLCRDDHAEIRNNKKDKASAISVLEQEPRSNQEYKMQGKFGESQT